jgi:hypothetical protein
MRTTVTLDPDVEAKLRKVMRERGLSFKEALNTAIRQGLSPQPKAPRKFKQKTYAMKVRPGIDLTKALRLAAEMDDDEVVRKMELRK